ncbi:MAG: electron transfer flavoprotein subunit alpha/FixB family protein [Firmicutes bacterium HGW-Firmicutes-15]|nr:MAG: electron transfer flavoprotein subunit alpha/FixB family protein [Firmicutes bacterium HGW-Firmicutes-15]
MAGILIYSEKSKLALELLTAARLIAKDNGLDVKVLCINSDEQAEEMVARGAETYHIKGQIIELADTAAVASALQEAVGKLDTSIVLLSSNRRGKELAGRLAQKLDAGCLSDVTSLQVKGGKVQCSRNALGGATISVQQIETDRQVIALAPRSFEPASPQDGGSLKEMAILVGASNIKVLESRSKAGDVVDIEAAEILVVVGQGMEQADMLLAESIARSLGGEIACSKPIATDKKWLPEDRIVGLSGKKCKPQLAIILGVSGQVQFNVGIRDANTIVAINNDENAYILQMADYAMVADLKVILPELSKTLG